MYIVKIMFDYTKDIIWLRDENDEWTDDCLSFVEDDIIVKDFEDEIYNLYAKYIFFDTNINDIIFDYKGMKKDKQKMLDLVKQLKDRLKELNDGSFVVEDLLTPYWENL